MSLQPSAANNPANLRRIILAVILVVVAAGVLVWGYNFQQPHLQPPAEHRAWFFDLGSKHLYLAMQTETPSTSPSGGQGVRAHVFSCGKCSSDKDADRWVGYVERLPDGMAKQMGELEKSLAASANDPKDSLSITNELGELRVRAINEREVASPAETDKWIRAQDPDGTRLITEGRGGRCPDTAIECFPPTP